MEKFMSAFSSDELTAFSVILFIIIVAAVTGYVMTHNYCTYLDDHPSERFSMYDFARRERFYIWLFLGFVFVVVTGLVVCLLA